VSTHEGDRLLILPQHFNHCVFGKDQFSTTAFFCIRLIDILGSPIQFDRCQLTEVSHETHAFHLRRRCFVRRGGRCQRCH